uniref:Uncharacterized protein n=1 Tax=Physcomitrium patens TaxID=3218 RepID=A0A7I4A4X2_PHYPA
MDRVPLGVETGARVVVHNDACPLSKLCNQRAVMRPAGYPLPFKSVLRSYGFLSSCRNRSMWLKAMMELVFLTL